ncbi:probetacellulin isoform X2 [Biomphalaria glabrata]|nr:probetacellulin isoform X2 [Biomphalaria glabrata]
MGHNSRIPSALFFASLVLMFLVSYHSTRPKAGFVISVPWLTSVNDVTQACQDSDGCGRTPARTKPQPTTQSPTVSSTTPGRPKSFKQTCTPEEIFKKSCLHGGVCFVVEHAGRRIANCHCKEMWTGPRCEEADSEYFVFSADKVEKAGIAAGVVVLIIIITVIVVYVIIKRRKQRRKRSEENGDLNGHAGKLLPTEAEKQAAELEETKV